MSNILSKMPKGWVMEKREVFPPLKENEAGLTLITVSKGNIRVAIENFRRNGYYRVRVIQEGRDLDRDELPDVEIHETTITRKGSHAIIKMIWHTMLGEQVGQLIEGIDVKIREGRDNYSDRDKMLKTIADMEMIMKTLQSLINETIMGSAEGDDYKNSMKLKTGFCLRGMKSKTDFMRLLLNPEE